MSAICTTQTVEGSESRMVSLPSIFAVVYLAGAFICLFDLADARSFLGDVDDRMRELQIRQLLSASGSWWDLRLPSIRMPDVYISPWSRLIDAPYVLLTMMAAPWLGQEQAMRLAFDVWPALMLGIFSLQVASILRAFGVPARPIGFLVVLTATVLMVFAIWEFVPGRIDHHNMQIIALMLMLQGLSRWDRGGGWMIGVGCLTSVAIALEGLPFIAVGFVGLVAAFVFGVAGAASVLRQASLAMLLPTAPLGFLLLGPAGMFSTQCDAFSAPYILLLVGCSSILFCAASRLQDRSPWLKVLVMAPAGGALLGLFAALFPRCLAGPYWMIDPLSETYWLNRVSQEHGAMHFVEQGQVAIVLLAAILAAVLTIATASAALRQRPDWTGRAIMLAVAWASLVLTLVLNRYIRFAFAFIPLFLPLALQFYFGNLERVRVPRHARVIRQNVSAFALGQLVVSVWLVVANVPRSNQFDAADYMAYDECRDADYTVLSHLPPGKIMAPQALALTLLPTLPPGLSVAAVPFHRASPGMMLMFQAFLSEDAQVRRRALQPFDYVAVCRFPLKPEYGTAPLYEALSAGEEWPGLVRLGGGDENPFQLFRIDHPNLK